MHHQLSNTHKLIFSAWNTNSGGIFTYSSHFPLKLTERGCRPARSRQGKSHHMFTAACDNNSLLSVVGLSSHLVLPPTVCDCPGIWSFAPGSALGGRKPVLGVLGESLASFFSSLGVHPRLVAVGGSGQCSPHWLCLGEVAAGRNISSFGSLLGQQTCHVPEECQADLQLKPGKVELSTEWVSQGCREKVSLPPAKVVSDWQSFWEYEIWLTKALCWHSPRVHVSSAAPG